MQKRSVIRFITTKITLKLLNSIVMDIGIALLIFGIGLYISERFEPEETSIALKHSTKAYTDISNRNKFFFTIVPSPSVSALPSESETVPPAKDDLATYAIESAKVNEDVIGWIRIEGTPVDYPVVQTEDNIYYLKHDTEKNKNKHGTIFLDYRCDPVSLTGISILYGHHMKDGSMFASLVQYKDEAFFESHTIIEFATLEKTYQWEIFSVFITDPSCDYLQTEFTGSEQYLDFITAMRGKSIFKTDILLSESDEVLILSTCTYEYDDARFVIAARRKD